MEVHPRLYPSRFARAKTTLRSWFQALRAQANLGGGSILTALGVYRYSSWLLTSIFYLLGPPPASYWFKLGVVLSLFLAGMLAHRLGLATAGKNPGFLRTLTTLETLGIACLLLPTGGLESPFVWYAINPIAIAAAELSLPWCWGVLSGFLLTALVLTRPAGALAGALHHSLAQNSYLLLIFLLLTLGVQLLARLVKQARCQARLLEQQRAELERSWELLSTFYRLIEVVSARDGVQEVADLFAHYSRALVEADKVLIWLPAEAERQERDIWATAGPANLYSQGDAGRDLALLWPDLQQDGALLEKQIASPDAGKARVVYLPVRSANRWHGVFVAVFQHRGSAANPNRHNLRFLADFMAVALERCRWEDLSRKLLLAEEQNRIAGEIHDGVAQYLFNITCGCHLLREKWRSMDSEAVRQQLGLLAETAHRAAQELRTSIYQLSPRRQGKEIFVEGVNTYLEELAAMNGIRVNLDVEGSEEVLSPALRKAFYRIIREACGNALRHGGCRSLQVRLRMAPSRSVLEIEDDGSGWQPGSSAGGSDQGLGIWNMRNLALSFDGELEIESTPGRGTVVRCTVPKARYNRKCREGVLGGVGNSD